MTTPTQPQAAGDAAFRLPRLAVMACPDNAGKHPCHDQRWIVTEGAAAEFGHDPRPGNWAMRNGSLVAMMRDCAPGTATEIIRRCNSHAALVDALTNLMAVPEVKKAAVNWATDELLAAYTALDSAKQGGAS